MELENYDIFFRVYLKEEEEKNGTIHHGGISLGCLSSNALLCYTGPKLEGWSQANGELTFEDDLRLGGLLCFISMNASIRTELADSMVNLGEPGGG